jgi:hypothetical protein
MFRPPKLPSKPLRQAKGKDYLKNGLLSKQLQAGDDTLKNMKSPSSLIIPSAQKRQGTALFFKVFALNQPRNSHSIPRMKATMPALLCFLFLAAPTAMQAQYAYSTNADGSVYTYTTNADGSAYIDGYSGPPWVVSIPTKINGLLVTGIGFPGFNASSLISVTIPCSVTSIGNDTFYNCADLTNATIPSSVTSIGMGAFAQCYSLTNITIPGSVTSVGYSAFFASTSLTSAYFTGNAPNLGSVFPFGPLTFGFDNNVTVYYLAGTTGWDSFSANTGVPAVLWNPLIQTGDGSFGVQNNQFGFNITGTNNFTVVVKACTNLASPVWTPLQTVTLTNGSFYFSDPQWTNYPSRFYGLGLP